MAGDPLTRLDADVPEIHRDAFERILKALDQVVDARQSRSILIHGDAGSGKTHLIARVRRHLEQHRPEAVFIYLRMNRSANGLANGVLGEVGAALMRPNAAGRPQLEEILRSRLATVRLDDGGQWLRWFDAERAAGHLPTTQLVERIEWLAEACNLDRNFRKALEHLASGNHRADIGSWLRGESLPEAAWTRMEMAADNDAADMEGVAHLKLLTLGRLAGIAFPFVYCFDQLEALQTFQGDVDGLFAFGQLCSRLVEHTEGNLVVSCIQTSFLVGPNALSRGLPGVRDADMARVAVDRLALPPLDFEQARKLIESRLNSDPEVCKARAGVANLWPIDEELLRGLVRSNDCTPRRLIARCKAVFAERMQSPTQAPPRESEVEAIEREFAARLMQENSRENDDTSETLKHGLPMLAAVFGGPALCADPKDPDAELRLDEKVRRCHISVCNQKHKSLTARLKRLRKRLDEGTIKRLIAIRDAARLIPATSRQAREHWAALVGDSQRVAIVEPTAEALAALEAMRQLLSDGRAGELSVHGDTIHVDSLLSWLRAHLPGELKELWNDLSPCEPEAADSTKPDRRLLEDCTFTAQQCRVLPLLELAEKVQAHLADVEFIVAGRPDLFGVLHGPPKVVYDRTGKPAPAAAAVPG